MLLVLQLHFVIMSKFSKIGVDTLNTFWVMGYVQLKSKKKEMESKIPVFYITMLGLRKLQVII